MAETKGTKKTGTTKKPAKKQEETVEIQFDLSKTYTIVANGNNRHLIEGKEYEVSGELASILVNRGSAKLVK